MRACLVAAVLIAGGCGRIDYDPLSTPDDASASDSGGVARDANNPGDSGDPGDAGRDAMAADSGAPSCIDAWVSGTVVVGPATRIDELATPDEDRDPVLSEDGLRLVFASGPTMDRDIFEAVRGRVGGAFGPRMRRADLSSSGNDGKTTFTADELLAVVATDRPGGEGSQDLWYATRASTTVPFDPFQNNLLANVNTTVLELDPHVSADGLRIYFAPRMAAMQRLAVAERGDRADPFGPPRDLVELNTDVVIADPVLSADERVIWFSGGPDRDIFYAVRDDPTATFRPRRPVPAINTVAASEGDPFVSADGCELFYSSNVTGSYDMYRADVASGGGR